MRCGGRDLGIKNGHSLRYSNSVCGGGTCRITSHEIRSLHGLKQFRNNWRLKNYNKEMPKINFDKSAIGALIRDIQSKKAEFQEIGFHFIPKTENTYAHVLAKKALKKRESHYLLGGVPDYVCCALEKLRPRQPD
ncbi:hypothetical protein CXB51_009230 [Gossypium anomalum]|uniref:RNase H type-1 domain-containing protein n=1 Tax=Gossypium anomalum TaxID=47600 RepID=A0A8J5Z828_9ROSI|nr:hypothetical protein CXB51_009230 [Gossypium anomalum]